MVMESLIVMGIDVASRIHRFDVFQKPFIDSHHVLELAMDRALFNHPDLTVSFKDGRLDLTNLLIDQNPIIGIPVQYLLTGLLNALWTEGVRGARPSQGRFRLLPRLL